MSTHDTPQVDGYAGWEVFVSAVVAVIVTALLTWWAIGFSVFYESLFRVGPTLEDGGVGADWAAGNTIPALDFLIALVHAADVILGLFVLFLVFVHWAAFRRLADRMAEHPSVEKTATDGGTRDTGGESS